MIIGLSGYARSGKDESAKALIDMGFERKAFADKLREFLYALNPIVDGRMWITLRDVIDRHGWDGYKETEFGPEIRELLQRLGTDCGRNLLGDNVWIDATLGKIASPSPQYPSDNNIVVTDCRFQNEAEAIKARGGFIIRINRPGVGPANDHPSETSLDNHRFDGVITNDGTIEELHGYVTRMVEFWQWKTRAAML